MDDVKRLFNFSSNSQSSLLKQSPHNADKLTSDSTTSIIGSSDNHDKHHQSSPVHSYSDKVKKLAEELTFQVLHTIFLGTLSIQPTFLLTCLPIHYTLSSMTQNTQQLLSTITVIYDSERYTVRTDKCYYVLVNRHSK